MLQEEKKSWVYGLWNMSGCVWRCSGEGLLLVDHGFDAVVHVLHECGLGPAESAPVGDVEDGLGTLGVLTVDAADLHVVLLRDGVELVLLLRELRKSNVDRGSERSSQIGRARRDVPEMAVVGELGHLLNAGGSSAESVEHGEEVGALLHGDDSELVLFVDPDEE